MVITDGHGGGAMQSMRRLTRRKLVLSVLAVALGGAALAAWHRGQSVSATPASPQAGAKAPDGWTTAAPRDEIRPAFAYDPQGGPDGKGCFTITADRRDGLARCW